MASFSDFSALAPTWLPWGLSHLAGAISTIDPKLFLLALAGGAFGSLAARHCPRPLALFSAACFVLLTLVFCFAALYASPAFWTLVAPAVCPVAMVASRRDGDPIRDALLREGPGVRN